MLTLDKLLVSMHKKQAHENNDSSLKLQIITNQELTQECALVDLTNHKVLLKCLDNTDEIYGFLRALRYCNVSYTMLDEITINEIDNPAMYRFCGFDGL